MTASGKLEQWSDRDAAARAWLVRLKSGEATQGDLASFASWRAESADNAHSFERAVRLWDRLGPALAGGAIAPAAPRPMSRRLFLGGGAGIAATIATVAVMGSMSAPAGATRYETGKGERKLLRLEEDVRVELNAASRLYYWPEAAGPRVELDRGEVLIAAACEDGRRLLARAEGTEISARNARFLLNASDGAVRVSCLAGTVDVRAGGKAHALAANHKLEIREGHIQQAATAPAREVETAWQRNLLVFRDRPADEVVAELNRYLPDRMIVLTGKGDVRITGVIHLERADLAVEHVARSLDMKVTHLPGGIALLRS